MTSVMDFFSLLLSSFFFQKSPTTIIIDRSSSNTIFTHGISRYVLPFDAQSGSFKKWCGRKNTEMQLQFQQGNQSENCRLSFTTIDHCSAISFCQPAAAASLILLVKPSAPFKSSASLKLVLLSIKIANDCISLNEF